MNKKIALLAVMVLVVTAASDAAWADRGRFAGGRGHHGHDHYAHRGSVGWVPGLVLGSALVWAATRPETIVYREPVRTVVVRQPAPVVIASPPVSNPWWYYCRSSGAYYPYTSSCPGGWEQVAATP